MAEKCGEAKIAGADQAVDHKLASRLIAQVDQLRKEASATNEAIANTPKDHCQTTDRQLKVVSNDHGKAKKKDDYSFALNADTYDMTAMLHRGKGPFQYGWFKLSKDEIEQLAPPDSRFRLGDSTDIGIIAIPKGLADGMPVSYTPRIESTDNGLAERLFDYRISGTAVTDEQSKTRCFNATLTEAWLRDGKKVTTSVDFKLPLMREASSKAKLDKAVRKYQEQTMRSHDFWQHDDRETLPVDKHNL